MTIIMFIIGLVAGLIIVEFAKEEPKVFHITITATVNEPEKDAINIAQKVTKAIDEMDRKGANNA